MRRLHFIKRAGLFVSALLFTLFIAAPSVLAAITITEYGGLTASSQPHNVVLGPDGNIWFTEFNTHQVGKMAPDGTLIAEYPLAANAHPNEITPGPDGRMWVTEYASPGGAAAIAAITLSGTVTEYPLTPSTARPHAIVAAPDGNMWFTEIGGEAIGRIQTDGTLLPKFTLGSGANPYGITVGPDGNIWFTEFTADNIIKMDLSGNILNTYPITGGYTDPYAITSGPDGKLWFTLQSGSGTARAVASITTTGTIQYYNTPTPSSGPHGIVAAPDGNIWFTEVSAHKVAMLVPATGVITEYSTPTANSGPFDIDVGPNNTLWFAENNANQIGTISGLTIPSSGGGSTVPQAPGTGFGVYQFNPVYTFVVFSLVATSLLGLGFAIHKLALKRR